ncbi:MAG: c-type cytochrome, partial [Acidimicrobiia bacterium]|nr:c-type cytochrome [Acidimicrobiia bacterium]
MTGCGSGDTPESRGEALVRDLGCVACHADTDTSLAPAWAGIAGTERSLADGTSVIAHAAYLRQAIVDPGAVIVEGWRPAMPNFYLADDEVDDIVAYLQSLGSDALVPTIDADEE